MTPKERAQLNKILELLNGIPMERIDGDLTITDEPSARRLAITNITKATVALKTLLKQTSQQ